MGKSQKASPMENERKDVKVPIKWKVPETIITRFASNLVVQNVEGHFKLLFFEIKPDIYISEPENPPTEVIADCVGSIIIPLHRVQSIIDLLTRQLESYKKTAGSVKSQQPSQPSHTS